jgi:hypothetical protein
MVATSYTAYLQDLKMNIDRIREEPFEFDRAEVQVAICKGGFAYRCRDVIEYGRLTSEHRMGPMNIDNWHPDQRHISRADIDGFFSLPEVFAYSDRVLQADSNPLAVMHWDATIDMIEIEMQERRKPSRSQRMLFAGFTDRIDAEFLHSVENEFMVHDNETGHISMSGGRAFPTKQLSDEHKYQCPASLEFFPNGMERDYAVTAPHIT